MNCNICKGGHRTIDHEYFAQRKKVGTALGKPLETQKKAGEDTNNDMPVELDNHAENVFNYKCICDWSKDDKYGFIPNTKCPVHGKQTKQMLSKTVPIR